MGVLKLGYLEIRVKAIPAAVQYYTQVLGLKETDRVDGKVYLKAWDELEHHSLVLVEGTTPGLNRIAFRLEDPEDLERFEDKLERHEHRVQRVSAGEEHALGEAIRCTAPSEHCIELYYEQPLVGNGLPDTNPDPYPDDLVGIHPPRMDHCLITAPEGPASLHFWRDVLGFRVTEQVVTPDGAPLACWLERTHSPHDIAFIPGNPGGLHHFAYWLDSWDELGRAADLIVRGGSQHRRGPHAARHHARPHGLLLRSLWQPQRGVHRRLLGRPPHEADHLDGGPALDRHLLLGSHRAGVLRGELHVGPRLA